MREKERARTERLELQEHPTGVARLGPGFSS